MKGLVSSALQFTNSARDFGDDSRFLRRINMGVTSVARTVTGRFAIVGELFSFFLARKRWWLVPMLIALLLCGVIIFLAQSSAVGPFIYTLF